MDSGEGTTRGGEKAWQIEIGGKPAGWVAKSRRGLLRRIFRTEDEALREARKDNELLADEDRVAKGEIWSAFVVVGKDGKKYLVAYNARGGEVSRVAYATVS